ncbi:MAG: hypothetical protein EPO24_00070 [Bacteroidetes bacterium]|nr:MAG: hypothetical protein EPO24_00070 [Bacteroidota bacterium]
MSWKKTAITAISFFVLISNCYSQGESALPFLLISPYAEANGMAEASVSAFVQDPLALMVNPAHLGLQSRKNILNSGYNHVDWFPQFQQADLWYRTYGVSAGVNLQSLFEDAPHLSVGMGYSRIYLNLGEFIETHDDPTQIRRFEAYESSDQFTFAAALSYGVRLAAGYTTKRIVSSLAPFDMLGTGRQGVAYVNSYDYGLLLDVPVTEIISDLRGEPIRLTPSFSPFFDFRTGYAMQHLGDVSVFYVGAVQADPLPRTFRAGMGINLGLQFTYKSREWKAFSFHWTIDASDILVKRYPAIRDSSGAIIQEPYWEYRSGTGDVNVVDEILLGRSNGETIHRKGWEISVFEFLSIRGGRFEEAPNRGNRRFNTNGFGIHTLGLFKFFAASMGDDTGNFMRLFLDHVDIRYDHSEIDTDEENHPLDTTRFDSINLVISN